MYYWELRRLLRQKLRSFTPMHKKHSYKDWARRRIIFSFVLFFIGWKFAGYALSEHLFFKEDEKTGEIFQIDPDVVRQNVTEMRKKHSKPLQKVEREAEIARERANLNLTAFDLDDYDR